MRTYLNLRAALALGALLHVVGALAQPANDNPCGATSLTVGTSCTYVSSTTVAATATTGPPAPGCASYGGGDVWFSVVVPASGRVIIDTQTGGITDAGMALYTTTPNTCSGTFSLVECDDDDSANGLMPMIDRTGLTPGTTVWIRVWEYGNNVFGTFQICAYSPIPPPAPANDNPCGATPLTVGSSCSFSSSTTTGATATTGPPAPSCANYAGGDVWFSLVVPANGQITIDANTGAITDGGMALYTAPSCSGPFTQVACDDDSSVNGLMPLINASGLTPGTTVYVRFWAYGNATNGTFSICAHSLIVPPGGCVITLNLNDSFGDGWGTSSVGISINGGAYTWYTVTGASNTVSIPVSIGNIIAVQYNNSGTFQNENSFNLLLSGGLLFASGTPPTAGLVFTTTVTCQAPPAPPEDCVGSITICNGQTFNNNTTNTGAVTDLNFTSAGCLSALERQGTWYNFSPSSSGTVGFSLNPSDPLDDYDFALWGPFPPGSNPSTICPPLSAPLRCSYAAPSGATGLNATALDQTEGAGGDKWVQQLTVTAGQVYLLYISNFSMSGLSFNLSWQLGGGASLDCTILPIELMELSATPADDKVLVNWSTASEIGTLWHDVERSTNGMDFIRVGRVDAMGQTIATTAYHFTDEQPANGLNYYRLRTVDTDGSSGLSHTVTAHIGHAVQPVTVVPNPATEQASLVVFLTSEGTHRLQVLDAQGRLLRESTFAGTTGANTLALDLGQLVAGPYQVVATRTNGEVIGRGRFVKE